MPTTISGTTGIDAVQPGTIAQADLAANVAGNGPAFIATQAAGQTVTSDVAAVPNFTTESQDTGGYYDTTTRRFTPLVAGFYLVTISINASAATATNRVLAYVLKSGVVACENSGGYTGNANAVWSSASAVVYMNGTTDYLEPGATVTGTGAITLNGNLANQFSACLIRAA